MNSKKMPFIETAIILLGELIVSLIVCGIYLLIQKFTYKVITGVALGTAVTVLNFFFLAYSTNKAFDEAAEARGTKELTEEEIEDFTEKQQARLNGTVKLSFIIRTVTMLLTLVLAFILEWFDVIATLVPLLMLRPIITVEALIRNRSKNADGGEPSGSPEAENTEKEDA